MAWLKGIGVAAVNYPTGMNLGGDPSQALIHATTTGGFVVTLSSVDLGQGIKTVGAQIPGMIRISRSETLRLRGMDYVGAAFANGASDLTVLGRHILPNAVNSIMVQATLYVPAAIIGEAVLSFLGLGVRPPTPSLGVMLSSAQPFYHEGPWMAVFPGVVIVMLTLALNLLGDGLRDALDPRESGGRA